MEIKARYFNELSLKELYDLLQLRSEVFVVEQDCAYQDVDGKDQDALHVLGYDDGQLSAYTRIIEPGAYFDVCAIGRVVVREPHRGKAYGKLIMQASMDACRDKYKSDQIKLSAQTYLVPFYNEMGFVEEGEEYLEDGIPHILMTRP